MAATLDLPQHVPLRRKTPKTHDRPRPTSWSVQSEIDGLTALTLTPTRPRSLSDENGPDYRSVDLPALVYEEAEEAHHSNGEEEIYDEPPSPLSSPLSRGHRRQRSNTDPHLMASVVESKSSERQKQRTLAYWRLEKETRSLQANLLQKAEECDNLVQYKQQLEEEMGDLTTSLFEEAQNMVRAEKVKNAAMAKSLQESNDKISVMDEELKALKIIVAHMNKDSQKEAKKKGSSKVLLRVEDEKTPPQPRRHAPLFREFCTWYKAPSTDLENSDFLVRCLTQDVLPCLEFAIWSPAQSKELLTAIQHNTVCIVPRDADKDAQCPLCGDHAACSFKLRLDEKAVEWLHVCPCCRDKIVSVCDFCTFIRHLSQGLVKSCAEDVWDKLVALRLRMSKARLSLPIDEGSTAA